MRLDTPSGIPGLVNGLIVEVVVVAFAAVVAALGVRQATSPSTASTDPRRAPAMPPLADSFPPPNAQKSLIA